MVSISRSTTGHPRRVTLILAVDVAIGCTATAVGTARAGALRLTRAGRRPVRMLRIPSRLTPVRSLEGPCNAAARRGRDARAWVGAEIGQVVRALALNVVCAVLEELDLTAIVRERVDINAVAEDLDVDAAVARLALDRVVDRLDLNAMVDRVDLDHVIDRLDLDRIVERVVSHLDLDEVVDQIDLDRIVERIDVDSVAARVDLDAIVARLDLIGLADFVVDGIDLPGIIRESSGSMASEALSGVRLQSLEADDAVSRVISRWLARRRGVATLEPELTSIQAEDVGSARGQRARKEHGDQP